MSIDRCDMTRFCAPRVQPVQSAFNQYCSQSLVFRKRGGQPEEELFYSVGGKGSGIWAVRRDGAREWLTKKAFEV